LLSVNKVILIVAAVVLITANRTYAAHSGAECYHRGHRIYVPDGLNYPRQAWGGWGISCRTATPEITAASAAIGADSGERPAEWCGWWMRQHLGGRYGPEFNVARNWLNAGRPLDGPCPGAIGVKTHHVFQVIRVVDRGHVLAISGNDHNDVRTRIRPTSDVIGCGVTLPTKAPLLTSLLLLPPTSPQRIRLVQTRVRMTPAPKARSGPSA
jgi:hypothetical protein